jgi:hypothetical protein
MADSDVIVSLRLVIPFISMQAPIYIVIFNKNLMLLQFYNYKDYATTAVSFKFFS